MTFCYSAHLLRHWIVLRRLILTDFDPTTVPDFKHLNTVHITKGSPLIFEYLSFVVSPIGKLIRSNIAPGSESHKISAVVETSLKSFPPLVRIHIPPAGVTSIPFEFSHKNSRCPICLSYSHSKSHCPFIPTPSILGTPLPPPPPLPGSLHHSQPSHIIPSPPDSLLAHSIRELQAKAQKDQLEIQYWQSVARSLKRKSSITRKPDSNKTSNTKRKRHSRSSQSASIPQLIASLPSPNSSPPSTFDSHQSTPISPRVPSSSKNSLSVGVDTANPRSVVDTPHCVGPSSLPISAPIPPPCVEPHTGVATPPIDPFFPRCTEHVTIRKKRRRQANSSDTDTDPTTAALVAARSRAFSPGAEPPSTSHGPIHHRHIQREGSCVPAEETPNETVPGKLAPQTGYTVPAGAQTSGRAASASRVGNLEKGKMVCSSSR